MIYRETPNEMAFEIWVEHQIDRIDKEYSKDLLTEEEYNNKMRELLKVEEDYYNSEK